MNDSPGTSRNVLTGSEWDNLKSVELKLYDMEKLGIGFYFYSLFRYNGYKTLLT